MNIPEQSVREYQEIAREEGRVISFTEARREYRQLLELFKRLFFKQKEEKVV